MTEPKKPLTEEERKERAAALQDRLEKARNKRLEEERKEAIEKEKTRRKEGQNIGTIKEDYQQKMMKKQALERKKQKAADAEAKRRVKEQVFTHKKSSKKPRFIEFSVLTPSLSERISLSNFLESILKPTSCKISPTSIFI